MSIRRGLLTSIFLLPLLVEASHADEAAREDWRVNMVNWFATDGNAAISDSTPQNGDILVPGQRIVTAAGQKLELYIGKNRIKLAPDTIVAVGDDDPNTEAGTFDLIAGQLSITVREGETATIGAPRLKVVTHGADFAIAASDAGAKIYVQGGAVTILTNGTSTEIHDHQVATVLPEQTPIVMNTPKPNSSPMESTQEAMAVQKAVENQGWIIKDVRIAKDDPEQPFDPSSLPQTGTILPAGTEVSTIARGEIWVDLVKANGLDAFRIRPHSIVTIGDSDPTTDQPEIAILEGTITLKVFSREIKVVAPHLTASVENSTGIISASPQISAVTVVSGAISVASRQTGATKLVSFGNKQIVRAPNTPPITLTPDMGHIDQMQ